MLSLPVKSVARKHSKIVIAPRIFTSHVGSCAPYICFAVSEIDVEMFPYLIDGACTETLSFIYFLAQS